MAKWNYLCILVVWFMFKQQKLYISQKYLQRPPRRQQVRLHLGRRWQRGPLHRVQPRHHPGADLADHQDLPNLLPEVTSCGGSTSDPSVYISYICNQDCIYKMHVH
jgi:hypothetical protein